MKYLKLYESYNKESIWNIVNQNLINDICDIALDYIDQGHTLKITIMDNDHEPIGKFTFNHDVKSYTIYDDYFLDINRYPDEKAKVSVEDSIKYLKSKGISYYINLTEVYDSNYGIPLSKNISDYNIIREFIDRIKMAYPNENIYGLVKRNLR